MLFFITSPSNIHDLLNILSRYAETSSQILNPNESTIYGGSISQARLNHIPSSLSFNIGTLTFLYIWVPIFKWRLKKIYFQPIMDKVKVKLASWKANLLSFASRIQFIKSFLHGMLVYSITIYSWSKSILKELEAMLKNFAWTGDLNNKKLVTLAWKTI